MQRSCKIFLLILFQMLFIHWNLNPQIFNMQWISLRYYSLLFALAFISAYIVLKKIFKAENISLKLLDKLFIYVFIGTNRCKARRLLFL